MALTPDQEKLKEAALALEKATQLSLGQLSINDYSILRDAYEDATNPAAILAILAQLEQVQGWQPIEAAPKDGTSILLYTPEGQIEGYWEHRGWEQSPCYATYDGAGGVALNCQPTHWRTLPPPPEAA